ncbi:hypothetical protein BJ875DRAFT_438950 [Amylocarpus encephaloides]|uniref:Uncharacterized protein n=1 Tax=Amylocarpus encephaloides TaxID=45428 RepID=A0A9P7YNS5_9HELO|nr:hypothetical protein BJ875DRAFT_438950 [Amylocarpus encephaloides]
MPRPKGSDTPCRETKSSKSRSNFTFYVSLTLSFRNGIIVKKKRIGLPRVIFIARTYGDMRLLVGGSTQPFPRKFGMDIYNATKNKRDATLKHSYHIRKDLLQITHPLERIDASLIHQVNNWRFNTQDDLSTAVIQAQVGIYTATNTNRPGEAYLLHKDLPAKQPCGKCRVVHQFLSSVPLQQQPDQKIFEHLQCAEDAWVQKSKMRRLGLDWEIRLRG